MCHVTSSVAERSHPYLSHSDGRGVFMLSSNKKESRFNYSLFIGTGDVLLSQVVSNQVPSALVGLTSVFGMRTGGSLPPLSPEWLSVFAHSQLHSII